MQSKKEHVCTQRKTNILSVTTLHCDYMVTGNGSSVTVLPTVYIGDLTVTVMSLCSQCSWYVTDGMGVLLCEIGLCAAILCIFSWWLKMWRVGQNSPVFKGASFRNCDFQKRKTITIFRRLCKQHRKDTILLNDTNIFSLSKWKREQAADPFGSL